MIHTEVISAISPTEIRNMSQSVSVHNRIFVSVSTLSCDVTSNAVLSKYPNLLDSAVTIGLGTCRRLQPGISGAGHFGHRTLRHQDTSGELGSI